MHPAIKQSLKAIALLATLFLGFNLLIMYQISRSGEGTLSANHPDVVTVARLLGGANLELVQSYSISGNWSGDIDRGFVARVLNLDEQALTEIEFTQRGDQLSEYSTEAVRFVAGNIGGQNTSWFPPAEELLTADYLIREVDVQGDTTLIDSARLLFLRPRDQMVFYAWVKF